MIPPMTPLLNGWTIPLKQCFKTDKDLIFQIIPDPERASDPTPKPNKKARAKFCQIGTGNEPLYEQKKCSAI